MTGKILPKTLTPQRILNAYAQGLFPMAESATDKKVFWIRPEKRGIIPLADFHIPRRLAKFLRKAPFDIRYDSAFHSVINGCAQSKSGRENTWINEPIREAYADLFDLGFCHTVEAWQNGELVGGLYGLELGRAFFGESMFSHQSNASKACLVHLVARLKEHDFSLLDSQFTTPHLAQFGAYEISHDSYGKHLNEALQTAHMSPSLFQNDK